MSFFEKAKRVRTKFLLSVLSLLCALCLISGLCRASNNQNTGACLPVFSLKVQKKPLRSIIKEISEATGYDIKINERWKNAIVTATLSNVDIEEGLKIISGKAGIKNHAFLVDVARKVIIIYTFPETAIGQGKDLRYTGMRDLLKAENIPPPSEEILRAQNLKDKSPNRTIEDISAPPDEILNLNRPEPKNAYEGAETIPLPSEDILRARHAKGKGRNESIGDIPSPPEEILKMRSHHSKRRPKGEVTIPLPSEEIINKRTIK